MENEIWKPIEKYPDYEVSNLGRVRSYKLGKNGGILKPRKTSEKKPYYFLYLLNDKGKYQLVRVHRLVAFAFIPKPIGCNIVNHLNGNKLDNVVTNLEWTDHAGNNRHAYETGLRVGPTRKFRKVAKMLNGIILETYLSVAQASRDNNVSDTSIRRACNGISKTAGRYKLEFVE
ncbi:NUMOD4 domain-containing protein [Caldibacillus thermoamylovorans]|uniref:NUMOD4 domain-containing protein n=1 Tax=Caldibacillus thermoamylovorans TaxID=35841 RepID=UPI002041F09A|nr:NUMOD4 domain-containing protein [Caldibacillus thermoamylovorans]MCM3479256.1 NUMOD4 domain-containing protein [Caldibacillus thermoamylovorans]